MSYRTTALWGRCPALTPLLQLFNPSRASGTADLVQSLAVVVIVSVCGGGVGRAGDGGYITWGYPSLQALIAAFKLNKSSKYRTWSAVPNALLGVIS